MIKYLLNPISLESFVNDYWDKAPFFIERKDKDYYKNILTIEQINEYLSKNDIRFPAIRMAKNGSGISLSEYSSLISIGKYASEGLINTDKLYENFINGGTIFLQMMRSSIKSLASFVCQLENELKFRVETHLFLTPNNSQGLLAHYDTTSSFIMQIYGSKTWILYKPTIELPTIDQTFDMASFKGSEKIFEVTLFPGDLLFIPRGFVHEAKTNNATSLHITTVFCSQTWLDFFNLAFEKLKENREFRKSSIKYLVEESSNNELNQLKSVIRESVSYLNLQNSFQDETKARQVKDNTDRLNDYINISKISVSSKLTRREDINYTLSKTDKTAILRYYDKKIEFPVFVFEILTYVVKEKDFLVSEISNKLDDKGKIVLSKKLIKEGFLKIVSL